jgi:hypothetical protein
MDLPNVLRWVAAWEHGAMLRVDAMARTIASSYPEYPVVGNRRLGGAMYLFIVGAMRLSQSL